LLDEGQTAESELSETEDVGSDSDEYLDSSDSVEENMSEQDVQSVSDWTSGSSVQDYS